MRLSRWFSPLSPLSPLSTARRAAGGVSDVCAAARDGNVATLMELVASGADCNAAGADQRRRPVLPFCALQSRKRTPSLLPCAVSLVGWLGAVSHSLTLSPRPLPWRFTLLMSSRRRKRNDAVDVGGGQGPGGCRSGSH